MAQVNLPPGFELVDESADGGNGLPEGFVVGEEPQSAAPQQQGSTPVPSILMAGLRAAPTVGRGTARLIANSPRATQKVIQTGLRTAAGVIGAEAGGIPGAVVGASVGAGIAPTQAAIREVAGRWAGEMPAVASNAGRGIGIQNYAKEVAGLKVNPADIISTGNPSSALDNYAAAQGRKIVRILDPYGNVAVGPEAAPIVKAPGIVSRAAGKVSTIARALAPLQGATAVTDLARTADPNRSDIGWMGLGGTMPQPTMEQGQRAADAAKQRADAEQQAKAAFWAQVRQRVLARLGQ